jgi:hypothetical protein
MPEAFELGKTYAKGAREAFSLCLCKISHKRSNLKRLNGLLFENLDLALLTAFWAGRGLSLENYV